MMIFLVNVAQAATSVTSAIWAQIATILVATALANLISAILFFNWRKNQALPKDYDKLAAAFEMHKQRMEQLFHELEDQNKDFAVVQVQQGRDMVGLRGQIKYIQGIINGKFWKRADDADGG